MADDINSALERFTDPKGDPVTLLRGLMDTIRPKHARDAAVAVQNWRSMNSALAANEAYRRAVSDKVLELLATRRLMTFFSEEGILPPTGFFSELWRKIIHKLLPEVRDPQIFKDCLVLIFHRGNDHLWFNAIPMEDKLAFWRCLDWQQASERAQADSAQANGAQTARARIESVRDQMLEALLVVSHRTVSLAFHPELRRVCPDVEERPSPFLGLHQELTRFAAQCGGGVGADGASSDGAPGAAVGKWLTLCRMQLSHAYAGTLLYGVRLSLTYLLTQLEQHFDRLDLLQRLLDGRSQVEGNPQLTADLDAFMRNTVTGETQRNSVRKHVSDLVGLLALRVTENASRTGEHYIASDWPSLRVLWRSAMGAGFIIAFMALFKIFTHDLHLSPVANGVVNSLNYGLGFVLVALLHFTIATKQPAMTAARIANAIHTTEGELREEGELVTLIIDTLRSQLAAILGNVSVVLVTGALIAWSFARYYGRPVVDETDAYYFFKQVDPFGATLWYASIAGVWLFVAGLISGYFDNLATYTRIGERIGNLRWLGFVIGPSRARRFGGFVDQNLGALMGNFLFGCMLGMTGVVGILLGLPIDVRHVTFSFGNIAYGVVALEGDVPAGVVVKASIGAALVGLFNLTVSFTLALYTALRSRGASFAVIPSLVARVAKRIIKNPMRLLTPPPGAVAKHH